MNDRKREFKRKRRERKVKTKIRARRESLRTRKAQEELELQKQLLIARKVRELDKLVATEVVEIGVGRIP